MAWTVFDKYIPQEWFNTIFSEVKNSEITTRPSGKWFQNPQFYFKKRPGLKTKTGINGNVWDTKWNILASKDFNGKMYMYTDQWYIYTFDWSILQPIIANSAKVAQITPAVDFTLNAAASVVWLWQEFTTTAKTLVSNINVKLKRDLTASSSIVLTMYVTTAADKSTVVSTSRTTYTTPDITDTYSIKSFFFDNLELATATKYFFYIVASNTNWTSRVYSQYATPSTYVSHNAFSYNWTTFTSQNWTMWFEVIWTAPLIYDNSIYDEDILEVNYLSASRYPDAATEYTVTAYNTTTWEVTVSGTPFSPATNFIGKYMYISSWSTAKYQQRWITDCPTSSKLLPSSTFNIDPQVWDKIQIFDSILPQLRFPQFRKWTTSPDTWFLFALDNAWWTKWIYMPERKRLTFWDNRVIQLTKDSQALLASSNIDYEIPITTTVSFGNARALNIVPYWWYIICFFEKKIWLVKKDIIDSATWTFAYLYQDILNIWAYSKNAFLVDSGELYVFGSDRRFYSVDLSAISLWEVIAKPVDIWDTLVNYFDALSWWDIKMYYANWNINIVWRGVSSSIIFKYNKYYKWRIVDDYAFGWNFFSFFYRVASQRFTAKANTIYEIAWLSDAWLNYTQNIQIYGPVQSLFDISQMTIIKVMFWFDGVNKISAEWTLTLWWYSLVVKKRSFDKLNPFNTINSAIDSDGTIWWSQFWEVQYGWSSWSSQTPAELFPEKFDVSKKIGLNFSYFKLDISNSNEAQMYFGGVEPIMNTHNAQFVSNTGVA